jgi:hypothetical protein
MFAEKGRFPDRVNDMWYGEAEDVDNTVGSNVLIASMGDS